MRAFQICEIVRGRSNVTAQSTMGVFVRLRRVTSASNPLPQLLRTRKVAATLPPSVTVVSAAPAAGVGEGLGVGVGVGVGVPWSWSPWSWSDSPTFGATGGSGVGP